MSQKRVLFLDDVANQHIARLVQVNLERAGYEAEAVLSVEAAREKMGASMPDMIIMDPYLLVVDTSWLPDRVEESTPLERAPGAAFLRELKADPKTADIPVIALSAQARDKDIFRMWQMGVDCYLTLPFNPMELLTYVKRIFDSLPG